MLRIRPATGSPRYVSDLARQTEDAIRSARPLDLYTVATLPSAANNRALMVIVTDASGGEVPAWSDGADWRRVTDRSVIS